MTRPNPFHELYVSETISADDFVRLFSPFLVTHAEGLFRVGNIIIKGVQGSGKSMLLSLLKPEIQVAYYNAGRDFPVRDPFGRFIGAGINLARSAASDFSHRPIERDDALDDSEILAFYFADFLNYWVVSDILRSIETLVNAGEGELATSWGIDFSEDRIREFVRWLVSQECWFGYLDEIDDLIELRHRMAGRISSYRQFFNFNTDVLEGSIKSTKTPIGEPISRTAEGLRLSGIIPKEMPLFVRIDQYEELAHFEVEGGAAEFLSAFRRMINKALATRDPNVSYRIGVRRYAWKDDLRPYGGRTALEHERNYNVIDLDSLLRRQENPRTWIFREFADDIFSRRLSVSDYVTPGGRGRASRKVFGPGLSAEDEARVLAGKRPESILTLEPSWPEEWKKFLTELAASEPLSAKLGEAWLRQGGGERWRGSVPDGECPPWEAKNRGWWKKERVHQALVQIAATKRQRLRWAGEDDLHMLSGGNALIFVSLCREIWTTWARYRSDTAQEPESVLEVPTIDPKEQSVGIFQASEYWFHKIVEQSDGHSYQRFVVLLGRIFRKKLVNDRRMAYPGHNGFSLDEEELEQEPRLKKFLERAVDFGHLFDAPHTTKEKNRRPRRKWYLAPIHSPFFQIPAKHAKEPFYVRVKDVWEWMAQAEVKEETLYRRDSPSRPLGTEASSDQMRLF